MTPQPMSSAPDRRFASWIIGIALGVPALAAWWLILAGNEGGSWTLAGLMTGSTAIGVWAARRSTKAGLFLAVATVGLLLLWPEMALRMAGFRADGAGVVQFGYPRPEVMVRLRRDPDLFWTLPPGGVRNREGFRGKDWILPRPQKWFRVALFGDSCVYQPSYTQKLRVRLGAGLDEFAKIDVVNLGVPGYSTYQGKILVERWADALDPQVAVIQYGWNDHWLAYGAPDEEKAARRLNPGWSAELIDGSRFIQWAIAKTATASKPLDRARVPLDHFRRNLNEIGDHLEALGITVVAVTPPTAHPRLGVPQYLIDDGFVTSAAQALEWHEQYCGALREIASERGWLLVDLAMRVEEQRDVGSLFILDGIHFSNKGLEWVADAIAATISDAFSSH